MSEILHYVSLSLVVQVSSEEGKEVVHLSLEQLARRLVDHRML
jgi:hypothetical protein